MPPPNPVMTPTMPPTLPPARPHAARTTLAFSAAVLVPFVWSVATQISPTLANSGLQLTGPRYLGPYLALAYGAVLLAMLSGALIGLAVARGAAPHRVAFAAVPGLWAFLFVGGGPVGAAIWLALGYIVALVIDWLFWRQGLTPVWWWPMRLVQTGIILPCLAVTALA